MLEFEITRRSLPNADADLLVVPATGTGDGAGNRGKRRGGPPEIALGPGADEVAAALELDLADELSALRFDGQVGSLARVPTRGKVGARTLLVVGLGDPARLDLDVLRRAGAAVADAASDAVAVATTLASAVPDGADPADATQAVVEGFALGAYRFDGYKSDPDRSQLANVFLHSTGDTGPAALKRGVEAGMAAVGAALLTRDLVNEPPGDKRPPQFADRVRDLFKGTGVRVRILDEDALRKGGYGGLLGVGAGSSAPPRLVELAYSPRGAATHVALVGKGITFDSGGLSLKTATGMTTMKMDMAGAASVVATVRAAAALGLKVKLTGILALAENMPSGTAIRPGDVLTIRGGKTVEVLNTDAEGRLVLADALVHACEKRPDVVVDLATLTGAVLVALGSKMGGLMATDDDLATAIEEAGRRSGEPFWRLPLPSELYGEELKGDIADIRNSGWKDGGTIRAGLFLKEFVADGVRWAHLDIAGLAWADSPYGYVKKGATGAPVRALVDWLRHL